MDTNENKMETVKSNSTKLWSKSYILILIAICVSSITMTLLMPLLPIYIKQIGGNIALAGVVVSVFTLSALIFRPIFAIFIDKYSKKPFLVLGCLLIIVGCFLYRYVAVIGVLILIRILHGIGYSASTNATGAMVADVVPAQKRARGIGYYGFMTAAAVALGPATGLLIMRNSDVKTAFLVAAVIGAVGLVASLFITYEKKKAEAAKAEQGASEGAAAQKKASHGGYEKSALPASIVMLFVSFAYAGIVTYLPTYAGTLGIEKISHYFIAYAIVLLVTRIAVDKITKNKDISVVLVPGIILMAIAFVIMGTVKTLPAFIVAAVIYALGYGSVQPTLYTIVVSKCMPARRGAASSTFFSALDLGIGAGALIWGIIPDKLGYAAIYYGCVGFMVIAAVLTVILLGKKKEKKA